MLAVSRPTSKDMKELILTRKHWQVFIGLLVGLFLAEYLVDIVANVLGYQFLSKEYTAIRLLLTTPVVISYPLFIGLGLNARLRDKEKFQQTTYWRPLLLTVIFLATYLLVIFVVDNESIEFYGLGVINATSLISIFSFPARRLKSIELKRNAGIWEYTPETFQFLCWPLGIWWTQPRLNKIATRDVVINE